jgi:hypothetical protein
MKEPYYHKPKVTQNYCYLDIGMEFELVSSLVESIIFYVSSSYGDNFCSKSL